MENESHRWPYGRVAQLMFIVVLAIGLLSHSGIEDSYKRHVKPFNDAILSSNSFREMRISNVLYGLSLAASTWAQSGSIDAYIASESPIAKAGVLANIGPDGSKASGAKV